MYEFQKYALHESSVIVLRFYKIIRFKNILNIALFHKIQICAGITHGRVLIGELNKLISMKYLNNIYIPIF